MAAYSYSLTSSRLRQNVLFAIRKRTFTEPSLNVCFGSIPVIQGNPVQTAAFGHKQPFAVVSLNVGLLTRKQTFEPGLMQIHASPVGCGHRSHVHASQEGRDAWCETIVHWQNKGRFGSGLDGDPDHNPIIRRRGG